MPADRPIGPGAITSSKSPAFPLPYIFLPNTKVKPGSALAGGVVSGALWETTGCGCATFVVTSTRYTAIYTAFATLIMFVIWLYISWLILLVAAIDGVLEGRSLRDLSLPESGETKSGPGETP